MLAVLAHGEDEFPERGVVGAPGLEWAHAVADEVEDLGPEEHDGAEHQPQDAERAQHEALEPAGPRDHTHEPQVHLRDGDAEGVG